MDNARKLELLQWMDEQIAIRNRLKEEEYCGDTVMVVVPQLSDGIHIYTGIGELAQAADADIRCFTETDVKYPFKYYFMYKGIRFFQLEENGFNFRKLQED